MGTEEINVSEYLRNHPELFGKRIGREYHSKGGEQGVCRCPFCGKSGKFYIAIESGLWDCKVCGEKGNFYQLQKAFGHAVIRPRHTSQLRDRNNDLTLHFQDKDKHKWEKPDPGLDLQHHEELMARKTADAQAAWRWLTEVRKFSEQIIVEFKLGVHRMPCLGDDSIRDKQEQYKQAAGGKILSRARKRGWTVSHSEHGAGEGGKCLLCGGAGEALYISLPFYLDGELVGMKYRAIPPYPKHWRRVPGCESTLFHFDRLTLNDKDAPLVLVEGEWDVIAMREMGFLNVTSLQTGASGNLADKWLSRIAEIEAIMICYDSDQAGRDGAERMATALGRERCFFVSLPRKDANQCLIDGMQAAVIEAFDIAEGWRPTQIRESEELFSNIWEQIQNPEQYYGISTGFESLDAFLGGVRPHEMTIITGHSGSGKSTFTLDLARRLLKSGHPGMIAPFEMQVKPSLRKMLRMEAGVDLGTEEGKRKFWSAADRVKQWPLYWLDHYGSISLQTLKDSIYYAVSRLGIKWALLDHLDFFLEIDSGEEEWKVSQRTLKILELWLTELPFHLFLIVHPTTQSGDETNLVQMNHLKGGAVTRQVANNILSVHRKRTKSRISKGKPRTQVSILKCRDDVGTEGTVTFDFDVDSTTYLEDLEVGAETADSEEVPY